MYDIKNIYEAKTVEDAIHALEADPQALVIAGGSDVLIKIREGKLAGCSLVGIREIKELEGVSLDGEGAVHIGPLTTFSHITFHPLIREKLPVLGYAVDQVGGPQIRNIGTVGGNVCNGVTSADSASTLFVHNALLELTGPGGKRTLPIEEFYTGPGKVALRPGELLTDIVITKENYEGFGGHYIKYAQRNAMDIATLGCAALCRLNREKDKIEEMRLAFGVAGPVPMRCKKAEELVHGQKITQELFLLAADTAQGEVHPRTSWRASKEFRLQLVHELSQRALKEAVKKAGGAVND